MAGDSLHLMTESSLRDALERVKMVNRLRNLCAVEIVLSVCNQEAAECLIIVFQE